MVMTEFPEDASALDPSEQQIYLRITELEGEIDRLKTQLEDSRKAKQILFLTGGALRDEVVKFFTAGLDMTASASEQTKEGFWLIAEALGESWGFGEVRDSVGNVSREMLARTMINRHDSGKPDDFPAILVVNTFNETAELEERDLAPPADMIKRANEDHILLVRTLDLLRLRQKEQAGFAGMKEFQDALRGGGGWFEVNTSLASKLHA